MNKDYLKIIDEKSDKLFKLADDIWHVPETCFTEFKSAKYLCDALRSEGFDVKENVADIKTAFTATYGSGKPVIGILGEFDALSGLSQKAGSRTKCPVEEGGNGHGCGHNLLGTAGVGAVIAIKNYLEKEKKSGTVIYFGCPAEEGGSGKAFMARDGVFDGLDVALTWHPGDVNEVATGSSLANVQLYYRFKGVAAHAAAVPHLGRSALDAVELLNVGVNFLREHVIPERRMHYAITNPGGYSPNVVQANAEVLYLLRAPKNSQVQEILKRVNKIAQGAALMTETEVEIDFVKACSNTVPNFALEDVVYEKMQEIGAPKFTAEEEKFAREIQANIENLSYTVDDIAAKLPASQRAEILAHRDDRFLDFIIPHIQDEVATPGSTDVGDVSWCCPTAQVHTACWAANTPGHSWQLVSQDSLSPAHKGMAYASKVMAATAIELMEKPEFIEKATAEWKERVGDGYVCPIPKGVVPRSITPKK